MMPRVALLLLAAVLAVPGLALLPGSGATRGDVGAGGAFTCDFGLPLDFPLDQAGPLIERDRMYMAARPGMLLKHIPILPDPAHQEVLAGGRYLFDTAEHAAQYLAWVRGDFVLDGVHFLQRPYFLHPDCHAWVAAGAAEFQGPEAQVAMRTWHWQARGTPAEVRAALDAAWPGLRSDALAAGMSAVWLLQQPEEGLVALVAYAPPAAAAPAPGAQALPVLLLHDLGARFDALGPRSFDQAHLVLTTWFPFAPGDQGRASAWPNSPPLPAPSAGDALC
ncbi:MAG: hypothetical protein LC624_12300, partial [Halobacteriales archaeon]|nr:hypothetical protein [Halobacteriales archaeon]